MLKEEGRAEEREVQGFVLYMPDLFEDYVEECLRTAVLSAENSGEYKLKPQEKQKDGSRPDFILSKEEIPFCVIDAKYKPGYKEFFKFREREKAWNISKEKNWIEAEELERKLEWKQKTEDFENLQFMYQICNRFWDDMLKCERDVTNLDDGQNVDRFGVLAFPYLVRGGRKFRVYGKS